MTAEEKEDYDDFEDDFDNDEILGYQCSSCGNIQDKSTGFGCDRCTGKCLEPWFG